MPPFERVVISPHLVRALQRGSRDAVEEVYGLLSSQVFTLARRVVGDAQLASEITHDTFVDVIEKSRSVRSPDAFAAWVRSVAVNHCLMRLRSPWRNRRAERDLAEATDERCDVERLESLGDLERALDALPDDARFVVWMHDVEGYTHAEIAALTGRTASYSKSQLARAYARLLEWSARRDGRASERGGEGGPTSSRARAEDVAGTC